MKRLYEAPTRHYLPARTYCIIRVDGKAFHSWTKGLERPFDLGLVEAFGQTMEELCQEVSNTVLGYCQSDEISLLLTDFERAETEPWLGGNLQKIVSVVASMTTAIFNQHFHHPSLGKRPALFDARAFAIAEQHEVANAFLWRQRDAERNAISMVGQAHFSPRQLHGLSTAALRALLLEEKGIDVESLPSAFLHGQVCYREIVVKPVEYTHKRSGELVRTAPVERRIWQREPAPPFAAVPGNWLYERIPAKGA